MEESAGIYRTGDVADAGGRRAAAPAGTLRATSRIDDHSQTFNTERDRGAGVRRSCSTSPRRSSTSALRREESRGAHQRTDFPARDDQRFLAHSLVYARRGRFVVASSTCRSRSPAGRPASGSTGGSAAWRIGSRCRSRATVRKRNRRASVPGVRGAVPEGLGGPRRAQLHQGSPRRHAVVPLVVPHGHLRQLRHDRQRRAEADLRHVPVRLRAGPGARRAAAQLSRHPRPRSSRSATSCGSWCASSRGSSAKTEKPVAEGEYRQTPERARRVQAVQHVHQLHAVLLPRAPIYGLDPKFIGPAAIALAQRYNLDSRDEGAAERLEMLSEHEGIWGCTFVGECTKVCPEARRSGRRHPALQADRGARLDEIVRDAEGRAMSEHHGLHRYHPRWLRRALVHLLVARAPRLLLRSSCAS